MSTLGQSAVQKLLRESAAAIRTLKGQMEKTASAHAELEEKLARYERQDKAAQIVALMDKKGLGDPGIPYQTKVASLANSDTDLDSTLQAVSLASPNLSFASVGTRPGTGVSSEDALDGFLLT